MEYKNNLEPYIFLTISESAYRIISKNTSWTNSGWCEYISKNLNSNIDKTHTVSKLMPIFNDLRSTYSFTLNESVTYVLNYFMNNEWETYLPLIIKNKKSYGIEMY